MYPPPLPLKLASQTEPQNENSTLGSSDKPASGTRIPVYRYPSDDASVDTLHTPPPIVVPKISTKTASIQHQKLRPKVPPKLHSKQPPKPPPKVPSPGLALPMLARQINPQSQFATGFNVAPYSKEALSETNKANESGSQGRPPPDFHFSIRSNSGDEGYLKALYPFKQYMLEKMASKPLPNPPPVPMRE